jgi:1,6-anhydro-N-acetylmuramate kinase
MVYRPIGVICNEAFSGIDIVFAEMQENAGSWSYEVKASAKHHYSDEWKKKLLAVSELPAVAYNFANVEMGQFIGHLVNNFIEEHKLHYQVSLVGSMGHTVFFQPGKMIGQLGSGAAIAAATKLPVVSDIPALDVVLGGNGKFFNSAADKIGLEFRSEDGAAKALCVALMGVLRWREEYNFLTSVTGASRNSIGGTIWLGQEA